jgi:hypothetical protein
MVISTFEKFLGIVREVAARFKLNIKELEREKTSA